MEESLDLLFKRLNHETVHIEIVLVLGLLDFLNIKLLNLSLFLIEFIFY